MYMYIYIHLQNNCVYIQDGVYMDEVIEVSVGAMHLLARSPDNRQTMRQLNTIRLFVQVCTTLCT